MKWTTMNVVGAGFGNHIDNATRRSAKLRTRARCYNLELLNCFQGYVNRCTLSAQLLAEETIVVVAAVKTDIVKNTPLAGEGNLVAVGSLYDANPGSECEQVFKLPTEDRRCAHG